MTFYLVDWTEESAPRRIEWPTDDALRRQLEIAEAQGDTRAADLNRRRLAARGVPVTRAVPVSPPPEKKARATDPDTSRRAAAAAAPRAGTCKARLLDAFHAAPDGLTYDQAASAADVVGVTASTRLTELVRDGLLERTGQTRPTSNGRDADVLKLSGSAFEAAGRTVAV